MERRSLLRFALVILSFGFTFVSMVQFGLWLADLQTTTSSEFQDIYRTFTVIDWLWNLGNFQFENCYLSDLGLNVFLIALFIFQHTFTSNTYIQYTKLWVRLHDWGIDKPLYNFTTGVVLQILMYFWAPIPIEVWTVDVIAPYFRWVHIFGWAALYGTSLMLDLPDLIGLTSVAINSPTITAKSPDLQLMYKRQRHMGLIPFLFIFIIYPFMSLDRLVLTTGILGYTFVRWRSETCYQYTRSMKQVKRYRSD